MLLLACDSESTPKLPPCNGEIVVKYDPVHFDGETHTLEGGRARYYRRLGNGRLVPSEPPYGTFDFIRYAQELVGRGGSTEAVERWAREMNVVIRPGMDVRELDPEYRARMADEEPARPRFVGVVADEPDWLTRAKRNAPKR